MIWYIFNRLGYVAVLCLFVGGCGQSSKLESSREGMPRDFAHDELLIGKGQDDQIVFSNGDMPEALPSYECCWFSGGGIRFVMTAGESSEITRVINKFLTRPEKRQLEVSRPEWYKNGDVGFEFFGSGPTPNGTSRIPNVCR